MPGLNEALAAIMSTVGGKDAQDATANIANAVQMLGDPMVQRTIEQNTADEQKSQEMNMPKGEGESRLDREQRAESEKAKAEMESGKGREAQDETRPEDSMPPRGTTPDETQLGILKALGAILAMIAPEGMNRQEVPAPTRMQAPPMPPVPPEAKGGDRR